jgi:K+-transporting ATPase KdpF subunit
LTDGRSDLSRPDRPAVLGVGLVRPALRQDLTEVAMGWEDVLGLVVTLFLLGYLLRAMIRAEKV